MILSQKKTPKAAYQVVNTQGGGTQSQMLESLELSFDDHRRLKERCEKIGIEYLCTPYEEKSADFLVDMGVCALKVASTDTTNIPFLNYLSSKDILVLLSTGMCDLGEVELAVNCFCGSKMNENIALFQCTSEYPSPVEDANLKAIQTMRTAFQCPVGFSDHTEGIMVSVWAACAGACMIEKHFTLDRKMKGPDHRGSIEPNELTELVNNIRLFESALGDGRKRVMPSEKKNKPNMQKGIVARRHIPAGKRLETCDLAYKRPCIGLQPCWVEELVGKKTALAHQKDDPITWASVTWPLDNH